VFIEYRPLNRRVHRSCRAIYLHTALAPSFLNSFLRAILLASRAFHCRLSSRIFSRRSRRCVGKRRSYSTRVCELIPSRMNSPQSVQNLQWILSRKYMLLSGDSFVISPKYHYGTVMLFRTSIIAKRSYLLFYLSIKIPPVLTSQRISTFTVAFIGLFFN